MTRLIIPLPPLSSQGHPILHHPCRSRHSPLGRRATVQAPLVDPCRRNHRAVSPRRILPPSIPCVPKYSTSIMKHTTRRQLLNKAFLDVYRRFVNGDPIPEDARRQLAKYTVSSDEFARLVIEPELEKGRFISLHNGHIEFDECTLPPHGEIISEVMWQIESQDRLGGDLFLGGTGNRISLFRLSVDIRHSPRRKREMSRCALAFGKRFHSSQFYQLLPLASTNRSGRATTRIRSCC